MYAKGAFDKKVGKRLKSLLFFMRRKDEWYDEMFYYFLSFPWNKILWAVVKKMFPLKLRNKMENISPNHSLFPASHINQLFF